jgi:hypothetical protein
MPNATPLGEEPTIFDCGSDGALAPKAAIYGLLLQGTDLPYCRAGTWKLVESGGTTACSPWGVPAETQSYGTGCAR